MIKYLLQGTVPVPEGGAWSGQMWLILVFFFGIGAFLIAQGAAKAARGTYVSVYEDPAHPDRATGTKFDPTPQPFYKHGLSIMGIIMIVLGIIFAIVRSTTFE